MNGVKSKFVNAGVNDVNVERASFLRYAIGGFRGNVLVVFRNIKNVDNTGGVAKPGSGLAKVNEGNLSKDNLETDINESENAAANVAAHEVGHASKAKLTHENTSSGDIMQKKIPLNTVGTENLQFNEENQQKLREAYNEQ